MFRASIVVLGPGDEQLIHDDTEMDDDETEMISVSRQTKPD